MKKFASILLALLLVFSLAACSFGKTKPAADPVPAPETEAEEPAAPAETEETAGEKVFACEELRITLTDEFVEESGIESYTGVFESKDCAVFILREDKSYFSGIGLDDYADMVVEANAKVGHETDKLHRKDGIPVFEYDFTNPSTNQTFSYYTTMYESDSAFWLVQFTCFDTDYKGLVDTFHKYARSVTFEE